MNTISWGFSDFSHLVAIGCCTSVLLFDSRQDAVVLKTPHKTFLNDHQDEINQVCLPRHLVPAKRPSTSGLLGRYLGATTDLLTKDGPGQVAMQADGPLMAAADDLGEIVVYDVRALRVLKRLKRF